MEEAGELSCRPINQTTFPQVSRELHRLSHTYVRGMGLTHFALAEKRERRAGRVDHQYPNQVKKINQFIVEASIQDTSALRALHVNSPFFFNLSYSPSCEISLLGSRAHIEAQSSYKRRADCELRMEVEPRERFMEYCHGMTSRPR